MPEEPTNKPQNMPTEPAVVPPSGLQPKPPRKGKKWLWPLVILGVMVVVAAVWLAWRHYHVKPAAPVVKTTTTAAQPATTQAPTVKNYGNKYADGILPVGDYKYSQTTPAVGTVYVCQKPQEGAAGAQARGPWFTNNNTEWDINKKISVQGSVNWTSQHSIVVSGSKRMITTNDLPDHKTGTFPIARTDPAYTYDRNPNTISAQSLSYALNASPTVQAKPTCVGGEAGVMTTGVALFDAFDAGGRDAGAWEIQDSCSGHPQKSGEYHYHTLSSCITDIGYQHVIGYALDGFPITGPKVGEGNIMTTSDLDECHGMTGPIVLDNQTVNMYHYVMTQDFPYSVSCFKGTPIQPPRT